MRPPYDVPSLDEIEDLPWNGLTAASLLAGCGGSCTGYRMAGFKVVWANEFIPAAAETYAANHPDTVLDMRDVRTISGAEIVERVGQIDLLDGSPPCAAFSTAGKRNETWGKPKNYSDTVQRVDDLFFEYARLLNELQPKVFVAENVSGLVKGVAKGYFLRILDALTACGYKVQARLLNAAWLGVPQARERLIFIGVRNDLPMQPEHPSPLPYTYTLRDALRTCPSTPKRMIERGCKTELLYWNTPRGKSLSVAAKKLWGKPDTWHGHARLSWNKPAPTVLQGSQSMYHPDECRPLTIAELKRVCSFPDDYVLTGGYSKQWERLGRSVPPVMMSHIAATIRDKVLYGSR